MRQAAKPVVADEPMRAAGGYEVSKQRRDAGRGERRPSHERHDKTRGKRQTSSAGDCVLISTSKERGERESSGGRIM